MQVVVTELRTIECLPPMTRGNRRLSTFRPNVFRRMAPSAFSGRRASRTAFSGAPAGITIRFFLFAATLFVWLQPDVGAIVLRPGYSDQRSLTLARPQGH